ncbi:hypothetical protein WHY35_02600 [Clostridium perfringens]|uniref:lipopolysaccharide biosynthesis protein n=1 Tax=Clostridium perfringens TaxID=1502 RepID=UPI001C88B5C4|nr:hypothetical protein [Clostridium perfringens]MDM0691998.1 hypothetical protein [Clostridium perfringens]
MRLSNQRNKSRTYNLIANSSVGVIASILQVLINYIVRIVIVRELGSEINGLNSLFESIINIMMLMEAGFGTAMVIHLYKPIEGENKDDIKGIMSFYRKIYYSIGTGLLIVGLFISYFVLGSLVTSTIPIVKIRFYFILFIMSFVLYYYTYHKRSILFAEQKNRISIMITLTCQIVFRTLEVFAVINYHNYSIFLILMLLEKLSENLICNYYINKKHPYLKYNNTKIKKEIKKSIISTVRPLLIFNITSTIQRSYRSILISFLLGNISIVGYLGNYQLVISAAQLLFSQFGGAFTSTFGNLSVTEDENRMYNVYKKFCFLANWIAILLCTGFIVCIQDFILFTFGKGNLLSTGCVLLLALDMFIYLINIPIISIQNALGLHNEDKNYMILQALLAIPLGFILGKTYGMIGIILGLLIPQVIFSLLHKGVVIFKIVFKKSGSCYLRFILSETIKFVLVAIISYYVTSFIITGIVFYDFLLKGISTLIICALLVIIFSFKNKYFREYMYLIRK